MKRIVFVIMTFMAGFINAFPQKEISLELYVKCCTGDVKPNTEDYGIGISVYKDSVHIGDSYWDYKVALPDTGIYVLKTPEGNQKHILHVDNYGLVRDTFDIVYWVEDLTDKGPCWMCGWCVMDGLVVRRDENGEIKQEIFLKKGKQIWYKYYQDRELTYYIKRNFWGKEKVILDKK